MTSRASRLDHDDGRQSDAIEWVDGTDVIWIADDQKRSK